MTQKTCTKCGETKPLSEFGKMSSAKDGHRGQCKACRAAEYRANPEPAKARAKKQRESNPEAYAEYQRRYREENHEALSARQKERTSQQWWKEYKADYDREYRAENKDRISGYMRDWALNNKAKYHAIQAKRRALKLQATPVWFEKDTVDTVYDRAADLGMQVDHIVPLNSDIVCGLHCHANLQLLDATINQSKGNRFWPDMPEAV